MSSLVITNGILPAKPVYIRKETWKVLARYAKDKELNGPYKLGSLAYDAGVAGEPQLIANTVIELGDECEYLIDAVAARDLGRDSKYLTLHRLGDDKPLEVDYATVIDALRSGRVFDQLELS